MEGRKIILIEDDPDHANLIMEALGEDDIEKDIILVRDGMEAIDYFQYEMHSQVSLVILDLNLPKVDGMDVLKFLKKNSKYSKIPVVILSTSSNQETIDEAYKNGANSYLVKPASYEAFVEKVKTLQNFCIVQ